LEVMNEFLQLLKIPLSVGSSITELLDSCFEIKSVLCSWIKYGT
jgi:hypothetical protein